MMSRKDPGLLVFGFAPLINRWAQLVTTLGFPFSKFNSEFVERAHRSQGQLPFKKL